MNAHLKVALLLVEQRVTAGATWWSVKPLSPVCGLAAPASVMAVVNDHSNGEIGCLMRESYSSS